MINEALWDSRPKAPLLQKLCLALVASVYQKGDRSASRNWSLRNCISVCALGECFFPYPELISWHRHWIVIVFMRFFKQEYWSGLPFPFPVDHVLSELHHNLHCLGWPCTTAWLIASLSSTKLWSMFSFWLAFCDCGWAPKNCCLLIVVLVMDVEAWRAAVHGVAESRTWLSDWTELTCGVGED